MSAVTPVRTVPAPSSFDRGREATSLVDLLTWTYRRQRAEEMSGRSLAGAPRGQAARPQPRWSLDGCHRIEAISRLGCKVEGGGWQRPALHPDAETVHESVIALSETDWAGAHLLVRYARRGEIPDWHPEPQRLVARRDANGRVRVAEIERVRVKGRDCLVLACPLRLDPEDTFIASLRTEYNFWFVALSILSTNLPSLVRWRLNGLGAKAQPWIDQAIISQPKL